MVTMGQVVLSGVTDSNMVTVLRPTNTTHTPQIYRQHDWPANH